MLGALLPVTSSFGRIWETNSPLWNIAQFKLFRKTRQFYSLFKLHHPILNKLSHSCEAGYARRGGLKIIRAKEHSRTVEVAPLMQVEIKLRVKNDRSSHQRASRAIKFAQNSGRLVNS